MWTLITSVCSSITLITFMMLCLCWRKKTQKNDLLGLDGLVTQKNPDENVNHLPSAVLHTIPTDITINVVDKIADDANKRPVILNNPRRSLPDIPSDGIRSDGDVVVYEPNGDNSSDLYATVEPYQNSAKRHTLPNRIDNHPSVSQHSSISQADDTFSPYARVKEHPYDKLLKTEHPYAQVQSNSVQTQDESSLSDATPRNVAIRSSSEGIGLSGSRRASEQSIAGIDIPAASAVAGGIAANQELPYMTPPITQPNFSGDSQDSSKGYTSISVREPLANIRAQTKALNKVQGDLDPHYSTVSDDSDDMYTTIQDTNQPVYTSGSETYAQIQPLQQLSVAVEINSSNAPQEKVNEPSNFDQFEVVPLLPSVDSLKQATHTHSRQASSSSSAGNVGSPKPEKRKANSPLPPPPPLPASVASTSDLDRVSTCKNLDDMYAKVQKGKKKKDGEDPHLKEEQKEEHLVEFLPGCDASDHNYETLKKSPRKNEFTLTNQPDSLLDADVGYEMLKHSSGGCAEADPNYEELQHRSFSRVSAANACDGYSTVNKHLVMNSSIDEVKSKTSSSYESTDEPNYESMPSESLSDPNYVGLKSTGSESDPNYESVNPNDPNYESVKYLDVSLDETPYELLQEEDSSRSECQNQSAMDSDAGYEKVKSNSTKESDCNDPGYETIKRGNAQLESDCDGIVQV